MGWVKVEYVSAGRDDWHKIARIGQIKIQYGPMGGISRVGDMVVKYGAIGGMSDIGPYPIQYGPLGGMSTIGGQSIQYNIMGKMSWIGDYRILYGTEDRLKKVGPLEVHADSINMRPRELGSRNSDIGERQLNNWELAAFILAYDFWKNMRIKRNP